MMTLEQICRRVGCSKRQVFRYHRAVRIKAVTRTKPALYPDDAVDRILHYIGVPSMEQLRDIKRRSAKAQTAKAHRRGA